MEGVRLRGGRQKRPRIEMTGANMKLFGCGTLLLYSVSLTVIQRGLMGIDALNAAQLAQAIDENPGLMVLASWGVLLQLLGGLGIPVFAFLLVEGFRHTGSFRRYLLALLLCGAVSEPLYDFAVYGRFLALDGQNLMFTYALCLVMLYGLRMMERGGGFQSLFLQLMVVVAALVWSAFFRLTLGAGTVLLTAVYYLLYEKKTAKVLLGCAVSLMYGLAPLTGLVIWKYSGSRGDVKHKYLWYALYPLHLLVLGLVTQFIAAK